LSGRMWRRLAAILAANVAGYSRLMGQDEEGTLARLKAVRRELVSPKIREHRGRIVKTTGDGLLVQFASPVEAGVVGGRRGLALGVEAVGGTRVILADRLDQLHPRHSCVGSQFSGAVQ
jgi:class 3 adenylate cyclase